VAKLNAGFVHVVDATGGGEVGFGRGRHGGRWAEDIMIMDELMIDGVRRCRMSDGGRRRSDGGRTVRDLCGSKVPAKTG